MLMLLLALALPGAAAAQKLSEEELKANHVKDDSNYIYGEGTGDSYGEADKAALQNLLNNIGMTVDTGFTLTEEESNVDGELRSNTDVKMMMNSYSQATVNNTKTIKYRDKKGNYCILRYMLKMELEKMFEKRKDRIENYVRQALRSEERGRVDDALRSLNWAFVLVHSLQYPGDAKMTVEGEDQILINWIPMKMREILENVKVSVAEVCDDNSLNILVSYKGEPAAGADFTYWNGVKDSDIHSVKDGMGHLKFEGDEPVQDVLLMIETAYADASQSDRELEMLMKNFKQMKFPAARKEIGVAGKKMKADKDASKEFQAQVSAGKREGVVALGKKEAKEYDDILSDVLKSVKSKSYTPDASMFTEDGLEMFNKLLGYGSATIIGNPEPGYYPFGERVVARSVPMKFEFKNNRRSFIEDVTFTFNPEKKIESVAFGLGGAARKDIFEKGVGAWSDSVKMVIVTFLENYKTAFALKRLDYINSIFDENAYIIVGHKLQEMQKTVGDGGGFSTVPKYEFVRKSKTEYIDQLKKCFASNEFVNVNFSSNDVSKAAYGGDTFGIQIRQDYYSEHYGDQGYLFLFVDLNDADKPVIKIRTWQPERNPDLTPMLPKSNRDFGIYSNALLK